MPTFLEVREIEKRYGSSTALDSVSFEVEEGDLNVILGPSGSGKSTLLKVIAGLVVPTSGRVFIKGIDITDVPIEQRNIGLVMQGYALFPHLTAYQNVAFPLRTSAHRCDQREVRERVQRMFALTGLEGLEERRPSELSGGQQQRVALARALVFDPDILLLDEPLAALDRELRERMQEEIRKIHRTLGTTVVFVTHDQTEAMKVADLITILNRGRVVQTGSARELYESPSDEFVARFLGGTNLVTGMVTSICNGVLNVQVGGFKLRVPSIAGLCVETQVTLMVRPEKVRVGVPDSGANSLPGTIVDSTYLGSAIQTDVSLSDGTVWRSNMTPASSHFQTGSPTHLHWRIEDTRVLAALQPPSISPLEASI